MNKPILYLYGPSGSGKSAVGRVLAEALDLPLFDLDDEIEARSGITIPEIFASQGESGFRAVEKQTLGVLLTPDEKIVSLGGGALTRPAVREMAENSGQIVLLTASIDELLARMENDPTQRPLLAGDRRTQLQGMLDKRGPHYDSFPLQIDTTGQTPAEVAWEIQVQTGRYHATGMGAGHDVRVLPGGIDHIGQAMISRGLRGPVMLVSDENVGELYVDRVIESLTKVGYKTQKIIIPPGEKYKTLETVSKLWDAFLSAKIERKSTVLALGGGVVGDLAGFAAATILRGVPWVVLPTSLLAMVDASLGGKTGFDPPAGKNLVGAFHAPRLVVADPDVLSTLPEEEFISGMAEVIKHGVIQDPVLFSCCEDLGDLAELVSRAMGVKVRIIQEDPYEQGIRAALNLGHTVGHGVEKVSGFEIRHGEGVAIGMVIEARMAEKIGIAESGLADKIATMLDAVGLPTEIPPDLDRQAIIDVMKLDKKRARGQVLFALPTKIGDVKVGVEVEGWETVISDQ